MNRDTHKVGVSHSGYTATRYDMRLSNGATYHNWLLATDRWLQTLSQGTIMGTFALLVSDHDFQGDFQRDLLPSESAEQTVQHLNGEGQA